MKPTLAALRARLSVDVGRGIVAWIDATKHHRNLNGESAGAPRRSSGGRDKRYWYIKFDGRALKRAHIVFLFATGQWPTQHVDHINGDSLDDRFANLREATPQQNAWNHKRRAKASPLPMGVRQLPSGVFEARITKDKRLRSIGTFDTLGAASEAYQLKRKELFGAYA